MKKAELMRISTRINKTANEWLDKTSDETGIPKSTLISIAIEKYKKEAEEKGGIY